MKHYSPTASLPGLQCQPHPVYIYQNIFCDFVPHYPTHPIADEAILSCSHIQNKQYLVLVTLNFMHFFPFCLYQLFVPLVVMRLGATVRPLVNACKHYVCSHYSNNSFYCMKPCKMKTSNCALFSIAHIVCYIFLWKNIVPEILLSIRCNKPVKVSISTLVYYGKYCTQAWSLDHALVQYFP